jgi:hypothetical protein
MLMLAQPKYPNVYDTLILGCSKKKTVIKYQNSAYLTKNWLSSRKRSNGSRKIAIFTKKTKHPNVRVLQKSKKYFLVMKYRNSAYHTKNLYSSRKKTYERRKNAILTKKTYMTP